MPYSFVIVDSGSGLDDSTSRWALARHHWRDCLSSVTYELA